MKKPDLDADPVDVATWSARQEVYAWVAFISGLVISGATVGFIIVMMVKNV